LELTILGSGTSIPSLRRAPPGYLLRAGRTLALLDSGPGTLRRILRAGAGMEDVTHIFYSHTHVDHTADLVPFLFASRNPAAPRRAPLTIGGSRGFLDLFDALARAYGSWVEPDGYELTLLEIGEKPAPLGGLEVAGCPVPHIPSSIALRLTDPRGRALVYSGDTDESDALAGFASGADVLLIESSFPDEARVKGHLTPGLAGRIAAAARPGRLVLTHFYPACEGVDVMGQLRRAYGGEAAMAEDQMRIEV
jgi:ribonuclease BN (tRNA processing enzyme)